MSPLCLKRVVLASVLFLAAGPLDRVRAQTPLSDEEVIAPAHTVESLRAKARIYTAKAVEFRKQAELHKEVARRFREERDPKGRPANSRKDISQMDARCKALSDHAFLLAKDAELLAEFYERHASELKSDDGASPTTR